MAWRSWSRTWTTRRTTTTSRKPLRCSSKIFRWKRMYLLLRADQRLKQNHKDVLLPAHLQKPYPSGKESGLMLSHKIIRPPIIHCRRNWSTFFVMVIHFENMMERLNSGNKKIIFRTNLCILDIGLTKRRRAAWQKAEETWNYFSFVLNLQENFFTSQLFKVIQDAILLILHYRTMSLFRTVSSSTFIMSDVQSITFHHEFRIDTGRPKFEQKTDSILSVCLWILWIKNTKILRQSTWKHRVLHSTCRKRGRNIKTRCIGSTSNLLKRKD